MASFVKRSNRTFQAGIFLCLVALSMAAPTTEPSSTSTEFSSTSEGLSTSSNKPPSTSSSSSTTTTSTTTTTTTTPPTSSTEEASTALPEGCVEEYYLEFEDERVFTGSCDPIPMPCDGTQGLMANPKVPYCKSYFLCFHRTVWKCPTPPGTAFDLKTGVLVEDILANCTCPNAVPSTTTTTTEDPTTPGLGQEGNQGEQEDNEQSATGGDDDDDDGDGGTKAGIAVGVIGGIALLVLIIFLLNRRRNRKDKQKGDSKNNPGYDHFRESGIYNTLDENSMNGQLPPGYMPVVADPAYDNRAIYPTKGPGADAVYDNQTILPTTAPAPDTVYDNSGGIAPSAPPAEPGVYDNKVNHQEIPDGPPAMPPPAPPSEVPPPTPPRNTPPATPPTSQTVSGSEDSGETQAKTVVEEDNSEVSTLPRGDFEYVGGVIQ